MEWGNGESRPLTSPSWKYGSCPFIFKDVSQMDYSPEWGDSARQSQIFFTIFSNLQENWGVFTESYLSAKSKYASEVCN